MVRPIHSWGHVLLVYPLVLKVTLVLHLTKWFPPGATAAGDTVSLLPVLDLLDIGLDHAY